MLFSVPDILRTRGETGSELKGLEVRDANNILQVRLQPGDLESLIGVFVDRKTENRPICSQYC